MATDNITGKYILVDRVPTPEPDLLKWGKWMEGAERHIAKTEVKDIRVSTVFLGLNHCFGGEGPPLVFETMIFGGEHHDYQERCSTWEEAVAMHDQAVELAKQGAKAPLYAWWLKTIRNIRDKFRSKRNGD